MKYLILVGDGMGGHPLDELQGKTTLEAASTPEMDRLCGTGEFFLTKTVPVGFQPGSDVANLSLMGYDPAKYYTGRAPLEAASMGVQLAPDETAFRCNFVNLALDDETHGTMVDFTSDHITTEESRQLIKALNAACGNETFTFHAGISYRHLLVVKGKLPDFTTVPPHDHTDKDISAFRQDYFRSSQWKELILTAERVMREHPVNRQRIRDGKRPALSIWPWGEGKMPTMSTVGDKFAITGGMISAVDLLKGIGVNAGLRVVDIPGATGFIDTNYEGKAQAALDILKDNDFVYVHLEAPDESGHQGSIANKLQAIEDFDSKIVGRITKALDAQNTDYRVVITMDHFTPIAVKTHTGEPVPTILYDSRTPQPASGIPFTERAALETKDIETLANGYQLIERLLARTPR